MAAPKGHARYGGRSKGTPNRVTGDLRDFFRKFLEKNSHEMQAKLDAVEDPAAWLRLVIDLSEFCAPKLARTEHTGEGGGPVKVSAAPADLAL